MITIDTNLLVYTIDPRNSTKQAIAKRVVHALEGARFPLALQAVGEFQNAAVRKVKAPRMQVAQYAAALLDEFETFPASRSAARLALAEMEAGRLSYWDALMLASAAEVGCTAMLTEDLQDGAILFGLEIVNPFGAGGISPRAAELLAVA